MPLTSFQLPTLQEQIADLERSETVWKLACADRIETINRLREYAQHKAHCETGQSPGYQCTCGLDDLLYGNITPPSQ